MAEFIDREAAIKIASGYCHPANIAAELAKLPAADVRPVVPAYNKSKSGFLCSSCGFGDFDGFHGYKPNFCPNCGAEMRNADD